MRILHLGKFYPPYRGGIESYTAALASTCVAKGAFSAVLAHAPPGIHRTEKKIIDDVEVILVGCYGQMLYTPISPALPWHLARLIRIFRPDILHLHMPNPSAFFALLIPSARKIPWIIHWHSDVPLTMQNRQVQLAYRIYKPWEQALLLHSHAIIATSTPYRDSSAALSRWDEKVHVIPLGLAPNIPAFHTLKSPDVFSAKRIQILAVGRLTYYKGFDVLLRALADIPEANLLLVGSGEQENQLRELTRNLGLEFRVCFAGSLDDTALVAAYANSDIFCLPSIERSEAFGLVLLEAMRARLPIVASAIPGSGVGFVVQDEITGLLVAPADVSALVQALRCLIKDSDLRSRFGEAGYRRWQQEFTLDKVTEQTLGLYREVLQ